MSNLAGTFDNFRKIRSKTERLSKDIRQIPQLYTYDAKYEYVHIVYGKFPDLFLCSTIVFLEEHALIKSVLH